jgi:signal peptidase I
MSLDSPTRKRKIIPPPQPNFELPKPKKRAGGDGAGGSNGDGQDSETPLTGRQKWAKFWREQIRPLAIMLLCLFSFRSAIADWNVVPTGSMKPTIIEGDRIFVNKLAYDLKVPFTKIHIFEWSNPRRGEIVVFDSPEDGTRLVKRVIGEPGDVIQLVDNQLFVNGKAATYGPLDTDTVEQVSAKERQQLHYAFGTETLNGLKPHPVMKRPFPFFPGAGTENDRRTYGPVTVPPGHYFMMGDNRDQSKDSRFIGFVPRGSIVGRSSSVIVSLNYDNYYIPRLHRWFRGLPGT